jgi:exonuclease SbcD
MRVLHTADWHLGQRFHDQERYQEHQNFLQWLITSLNEHQVDLLLVSGDIFDIQNPPNQATELYYKFLVQFIKETNCQNAIITGGNHDSIYNLNAPKDLLKFMKLHIVGGATENIEDEIIEVKNKAGDLEAVVCAVPFLRDKDIHYNRANLGTLERERHIVDAIKNHYQRLADVVKERQYAEKQIPILTMGHLFAQGCKHSEEEEYSEAEKNIYIGNLGKVPAETFPDLFNYVALGHLHSSQIVGGKEHIRYSGSPIPLSFSERKDEKSVLLIDFDKNKIKYIEKIIVPNQIYKRLLRFEGTLEKVIKEIEACSQEQEIWAEVVVQTDTYNPHINLIVEEAAEKNGKIRILKTTIQRIRSQNEDWAKAFEHQNLQEVSPEDVFRERCKKDNFSEQEIEQELIPLFQQVIGELQEDEKN